MASAKLTRTLSGNGNQNTATFSVWIKRSAFADQRIYTSWYDGNNQFNISFVSNGLRVTLYQSSSFVFQLITSRLFRDPSAWSHIVVAIDTTQGTEADRVKIYVNGSQETSFSTSSYPNQNTSMPFGLASYNQRIGERDGDEYFDGLMTHFHYTDGTAYAASTFGESDSTSGIWKPKTAPSVTYGTNGFFLKFENSGAMGTDSSGNSNTFTVGGTLTQNVDSPSNNFASINRLDAVSDNAPFANANLTWSTTSASHYFWGRSTLGVSSGKYYFEAKLSSASSYNHIGICDIDAEDATTSLEGQTYGWGYKNSDGKIYTNSGSGTTYGDTFTTGDIIGVALDLDNNKLYFSKNGTWQNSGVPTSGSTGTGAISITAASSTSTGNYFFVVSDNASGNNVTWQCNFGQGYFGTTQVASAGTSPSGGGIFEYDCPTNYQSLSTKGINSF